MHGTKEQMMFEHAFSNVRFKGLATINSDNLKQKLGLMDVIQFRKKIRVVFVHAKTVARALPCRRVM